MSRRPTGPRVTVPADALVVLVGAAGSGKSTLAARHFESGEVLSSDDYRAAISGDPTDQSVNDQAFGRLHADLEQRLVAGSLTVVDATNVQDWARQELLAAARRHRRPVVAIVLAIPLADSLARNADRPMGRVPSGVVRRQDRYLRESLPRLAAEGYRALLVISDPRELERLKVRRASDTTKRPEGTAPGPLMQSPEPSPGP